MKGSGKPDPFIFIDPASPYRVLLLLLGKCRRFSIHHTVAEE